MYIVNQIFSNSLWDWILVESVLEWTKESFHGKSNVTAIVHVRNFAHVYYILA